MKKNYEFITEVIDYTHDGLGVVKLDDFPFFVEDVIVGEIVKVKVVKINKNLGYAKLLEIIEPSSERVDVMEKTSGATLLHLSYKEQLRFKTESVRKTLSKIMNNPPKVLNTLGMKFYKNYRNKSVFPVQKSGNEIKMGYYKPRTHEVLNSNNCSIQYVEHNELSIKIREILNKLNIDIYDEKTHTGSLRHIMIRTNSSKTEIMIGLIATNKFEKIFDLVNEIKTLNDNIKSIVLNINNKKTNVILGERSEILSGSDYITDVINGIKFNISLKSFYQVNSKQMETLYNKVIELANLKSTDIVIDAYCGIGTISLFIAKKVKKVYGIEVVKEAINNAKENAKINFIDNAEFLLGKSEDVIKTLIYNGEKIDVVIVDPPRKGCDKIFLQDLVNMGIGKIVYVSCNPATLARDIKILQNFGYKAEEVQPVDMFPGTYHVECVVLLTRK